MYQQLNMNNKSNKQKQRQNHGYKEHFDGCQIGVGVRGGVIGEGIKKYK